MCGVTDVDGCDTGTTRCMLSTTADAATSSLSSAASAAEGLCDITHQVTDNRDPAVPVIDSGSKSIAPASNANINTNTGDEVCNSTDTTWRQSSVSPDILQTPVDAVSQLNEAANSATSSVSEPPTTESTFRFSVAGYDFSKYTDMVIVSE